MPTINIKVLSENNLAYLKKNIEHITQKIMLNSDNSWLNEEFEKPIFITKSITIDDFDIKENSETKDKTLDFENSIMIFEKLRKIPRYILTDEKFWLWLELDKFYKQTKSFMKINSVTTIKDHWTFERGIRRGLMFGVLSRCYFRVEMTVDEKLQDKYLYTRWIINNVERFRNLSWRSLSSQPQIVRGVIKGEYKAIEIDKYFENNKIYTQIAKYVSEIGSVRLLDIIEENDLANMVYKKMKELLKEEN